VTRRPRRAAGRRALAALSLLVLVDAIGACGTESIELRPASEEPAPPPESDVQTVDDASPPAPGAGQPGATPVSAPGRDGVLVPEGQLLPPPVPDGPPKGCTKIDFLFVIDNSSSMRDEQQNLVQSFPGFVDVMRDVVDVTDFHMMVVSTSGDREDEDEPALDADECDEIQGAGRRFSRDGDDCGIQGGRSYIDQAQPDLEATFSCVAEVGTGGSLVEEPMDSLIAATSAGLNAPGRCNDGFLRDDAILVVTVITDEEDDSDSEPEEWPKALLAAKKGNPDAIVVLGLVGDNNIDGGLRGGPCSRLDADGAPRLQQFVDSFSGMLGSVCAPDYTPFFQTAVGSIDSACEDFVPPVIE
jgi:hypothetical protein